jgi:hypothetical protein
MSKKDKGGWRFRIGSPAGKGPSSDAEKKEIADRLKDIGQRVDRLEQTRGGKVPVH